MLKNVTTLVLKFKNTLKLPQRATKTQGSVLFLFPCFVPEGVYGRRQPTSHLPSDSWSQKPPCSCVTCGCVWGVMGLRKRWCKMDRGCTDSWETSTAQIHRLAPLPISVFGVFCLNSFWIMMKGGREWSDSLTVILIEIHPGRTHRETDLGISVRKI